MSKDKFRKRQERRRLIRGEMTKRGISGRKIAAQLGITPGAVSKYCATSPRIVAALIEAGLPAKLFGDKARVAQSPAPTGAGEPAQAAGA